MLLSHPFLPCETRWSKVCRYCSALMGPLQINKLLVLLMGLRTITGAAF